MGPGTILEQSGERNRPISTPSSTMSNIEITNTTAKSLQFIKITLLVSGFARTNCLSKFMRAKKKFQQDF